MIRGIHHVGVHVKDINKMIDFYKNAFGFKALGDIYQWENDPMIDQIIGEENSAAKTIMMRAGNCYIELFQFTSPEPDVTEALRPRDRGYTHFCVDVTDIHKEFSRLEKLGMTFAHTAPVDAGHVITIYGKDPEGNLIELQETQENCDFKL